MAKGEKKKKNRKYSEEQINFVVELVGGEAKMEVTPAARLMCEHFGLVFDDSIGRLFRKKMQEMGVTNNTKRIEDHEMFKSAKLRRYDREKQRFIITWAQSYSAINQKFWEGIKAYADHINAGIHVIAGRYKNPTSLNSSEEIKEKEYRDNPWDSRLEGYLDANRQNLHSLLTVCGDVKVQPTAATPLSGFNGLTGLESCIIGHPRVHMDACPVLVGYPNKMLYTTGAVTMPDYTDTKAGKKGEFNHQYGFVIVEIDGQDVHVRQVQAEENGSFYDLIYYVENGEVTVDHKNAAAIVFGDMHIGQHDPKAVNLSFKMARKLGAKTIVLHDIFDSHSISHHELDDPFIQMQREKDGTNSLEREMKNVAKFLRKYEDEFKFVAVRSNHDEFVDRWLKSNDWRKNVNRESYLKLASVKAKGKAPKGILPYYLEKKVKNLVALGINDSYPIKGYECAIHGHKGSNGSRGSHIQFKNLNVKNITGHCLPGKYMVQVKGKGWKEIKSVREGDYVLSWNHTSNQNEWNLVNTKHEYDYDDIMFKIEGNGFEQIMTKDHHLMLNDGSYLPISEAICTRSASELPLSSNGMNNNDGISVPKKVIQQIVAIAADGSIDEYRVSFNFKKERKIERLKTIFGDSLVKYNGENERYRILLDDDIITEIIKYKPSLKTYKFLGDEILAWNKESLEILIEELRFWDGTFDTTNNGRQFSTTHKKEANVISSVLTMCGYSNRSYKKKDTNLFILTWCDDKRIIRSTQNMKHSKRFNSWGMTTFKSKSKVYCVSVDNKCFWVKSGNTGQVSLTGNCHTPRRYDGHLSVGTLTHKRLDYTEGPSTWNQANVVIYPNGKASHIIISPEYRFTTLF